MADQLSPCLLFIGSVDKDGYGRVSFGKAVTSAHRRAYCVANGLGLSDIYRKVVRHRCDNRLCINAEHLVLGTQGQNMQDMVDRGRSLKGEANPQAKLTSEQVEYIKLHYIPADKEFSATALARRLGVSIAMISAITTGKNW